MTRRRYQTGQLIDGGDRWEARWREDVIDPMTGNTKRVRKWDVLASKKECPNKRMAQRLLDEKLREINRDDYKPTPTDTFAGFAQKWMETVMIHHKPSTQRSEKSVIAVHLLPVFGDFPLREMTAEVLQAWVSDHSAAPKTVKNIVTTLKTMWATAKAWGYVQTDPFQGLRMQAVTKGNTYNFTVDEALAIIDAAQGWKKVFFRILAETGMRPGELAGLRRCDVLTRSLRIGQSVWQRQVQTPKTKTAMRSFAISAGLSEEIQAHILATKDQENKHDLVFTAESGRPLSMDNFRHRTLNPILDKLGIRQKIEGQRCGNYAFRHMNATLMDNLGTPLKTRQNRLGHADATTTMEHYTHAVDADDLATADQIGALLSPKKGEAVQ